MIWVSRLAKEYKTEITGVFDLPWPARVYYAGSVKSSRVLEQLQAALAPGRPWMIFRLLAMPWLLTTPRVARGAKRRWDTFWRPFKMLFFVTPAALAANKLEAAAPEEQSSRLPEHCTSITIEVIVAPREIPTTASHPVSAEV